MSAPTFVASYIPAVGFIDSTVTKTVSVTCADGDALVVVGCSEGSTSLDTPTGQTGFSWSKPASIAGSASQAEADVWTATVGVGQGQTFTASIHNSLSAVTWGFAVFRFSGSDGLGAAAAAPVATGGPSLALTTVGDNSAIVAVNADWNAASGSSRTWRTVNSITPTAGNGLEREYETNASKYTAYAAYWSDAGTAGSKTVGLSAPTGQKYSLVAVEVKGTAAAATAPPANALVVPSLAAVQAGSW